jgi:hypothetical protein
MPIILSSRWHFPDNKKKTFRKRTSPLFIKFLQHIIILLQQLVGGGECNPQGHNKNYNVLAILYSTDVLIPFLFTCVLGNNFPKSC